MHTFMQGFSLFFFLSFASFFPSSSSRTMAYLCIKHTIRELSLQFRWSYAYKFVMSRLTFSRNNHEKMALRKESLKSFSNAANYLKTNKRRTDDYIRLCLNSAVTLNFPLGKMNGKSVLPGKIHLIIENCNFLHIFKQAAKCADRLYEVCSCSTVVMSTQIKSF